MKTSDYILEVGQHDVLCGRGAKANNNEGNKLFRQLIKEHKLRYIAAAKVDKPNVAREVVKIWRNKEPRGRFLMKVSTKMDGGDGNENELWYDIGDDKARMKASQCLREKTPDVLPYVKMMKKHDTMQDAMTLAAPIPNQFPSSIPTPNASIAGTDNPSLNPLSNGFLPITPTLRMNFPSLFLNYQQMSQQLASQEQKLAMANGEAPNFLGSGPFTNPTQLLLSSFQTQQQRLPANINLCTPTIPQLQPLLPNQFLSEANSSTATNQTKTAEADQEAKCKEKTKLMSKNSKESIALSA